jgi:hypothetical protein
MPIQSTESNLKMDMDVNKVDYEIQETGQMEIIDDHFEIKK